MTGKWEKLRTIMDDSDSPWHGYDVTDLMDRLEREEADVPRERCEECARAYGALMRAGILPTDDAARVDSMIAVLARQRDEARNVPVPIPSAEACEAAVVAYLRRCAKVERDRASRLLADTMQNRPDADRRTAIAFALDECADTIQAGKHWR